jgi:hypothetical protein
MVDISNDSLQQDLEGFENPAVDEAVTDPPLVPAAGDDARFLEQLQALGDVRLGEGDALLDLADAAVVSHQLGQKP